MDNESNEEPGINDWSLTAAGATAPLLHCESNWATGAVSGEVCPDTGVGFAPDGRRLVFAGAELHSLSSSIPRAWIGCSNWRPQELFTRSATGAVRRVRVRVPIVDAEHPEFMPDGQTIVFAGRAGRHAPAQLYTVGLDGRSLQQITNVGGTNPAPCPDGKIVYSRGGGLYVLSANLKSSRWLARGSLPDCSRDSQAVVFLRRFTLFTIKTNGRQLRRLSAAGTVAGRPTFSPAGGAIAFVYICQGGPSDPSRADPSQCYSNIGGATYYVSGYVLGVINLAGAVLSDQAIGCGYCQNADDVGQDSFGQLAWQTLPVGQTTSFPTHTIGSANSGRASSR
jgi:WD40-like Beta Propeller Repeat